MQTIKKKKIHRTKSNRFSIRRIIALKVAVTPLLNVKYFYSPKTRFDYSNRIYMCSLALYTPRFRLFNLKIL